MSFCQMVSPNKSLVSLDLITSTLMILVLDAISFQLLSLLKTTKHPHKKINKKPAPKYARTSFSTELLSGGSLNDGLVSLRKIQLLERLLLIK